MRSPGGYVSLTVEVFLEFICFCDGCEWVRISELHSFELETSSGSNRVEEIVVEGGEALVEESPSFVVVDSPPYSPTIHTFFPAHPQDTGSTSP